MKFHIYWISFIILAGIVATLIFSSIYIRAGICIALIILAFVDLTGERKFFPSFWKLVKKIFDAITSLG
ncbi:hypothetical protein [Pseudomonas tohonis]|uniref:hypothetical protein n=1 Tax=Pseudomonas tohonis TaxID=2725477 RepID=UPI0022F0F166|nr:hypothetical protein [Pseudomonas tohonis]